MGASIPHIDQANMSLINALSANIAVVNSEGTIIATNQAWDRFARENGIAGYQSYGVGISYFDTCREAIENGDAYALQTLLGLKDVLKGKREEFYIEYPCHSPDQQRWFQLRATRLNAPEKGLIIAHENTTAQRIAEHKLRESEERYRLQFENSLECIIIAKPNGEILDANPMALKTLGYPLEELQQIGRDGLIDPVDSRITDALEKREQEGHFIGELNYRRSDGAVLTVSLSSKIYSTTTGGKRTILMFHDITEQKLIEKKLDLERTLSKTILDNLPGTFCMINADGYPVQWNRNLENVLCYSSDELGSLHVTDLVIEEDRENLASALEEVFQKGEKAAELDLLTKDGRTLPFFFVGVKFISDDHPYVIALGLNMEEQAAIENELNVNRLLFTQLFENSPIGTALVSESLKIQMINRGFTNVFEYTEDEAIGKNLVNLITPEDTREEVRCNASNIFNDQSYQVETERLTKSGKRIPVLIIGIPVMMEENGIAAFVMFVDITERRQLEETRKILFEKERAARIEAEVGLQNLENIFQNAPVASCLLTGSDYVLTYANEAFNAIFEKDLKLNKPIRNSLPDVHEQGFFAPLEMVRETNEPYFGQETKLIIGNSTNGQRELYLTFVYRPFQKTDGDVSAILIQALDVTEQVLNRKAIQESLKQKEILIQEVHHRVKNNLALITSLLELQIDETENLNVAHQLKQTQMRIHSIADIHKLLYQQDNLIRIPFHDYLDSQLQQVEESYKERNTQIQIKKTLNRVELNVNQAIPCGLLVNEIMNYLYKFSMIKQRPGYISVDVRERIDSIYMHFMLDGIFLTNEMNLDKKQSLSMCIIRTLVEQLDAQIRIYHQPRFELFLSFPKSEDRGAANYLLD